MKPIALPPNPVPRLYRGGEAIAALRGIDAVGDNVPEDWVGSTTTVFGEDDHGLSRLEDGRLLREAITAQPEEFLGPDHVARFGADPSLLVKLLDAGERLPVHLHPGRAFARRQLGSGHGKTEGWLIVHAAPGARVHLGFRHDVEEPQVRRWIDTGDAAALLAALHEVPVAPGDAVLVPAGTPHAIGEGILLVELQEPSDYSILLEPFPGAGAKPELGLGWDVALEALERRAMTPQQRQSLARPGRTRSEGIASLFPEAAAPYFRGELISGETPVHLDAGFSVLVTLDGSGELRAGGDSWPLRRGETVLIPHGAGEVVIQGVRAMRCRPPDPSSGEGEW